ncbi:hypothetical protein RFN66_03830 [Bacillus paralicheniformis]|uniref:hypothetical protein n=1 Tax=Bacillus paralicheniformis TaxID=1648923 RepID=UPI00074149BB|nr:hypothetical protein [Bacillus paralicheniformis]KUL16237.1 hypothetical protein LI6934_17015 [Bacillus licheniformis LMG 6934]MED0807731.1 hypothetical protein [Bacillus paralicheniformis]TWJ81761.1 hypothetical protein CHCC5019_4256 [Bacillus paralicheniformis]WMW48129.1 hypothetical protein RFN66_03830 [Bacillus paralicheniformis]
MRTYIAVITYDDFNQCLFNGLIKTEAPSEEAARQKIEDAEAFQFGEIHEIYELNEIEEVK